MSDSVGKDGIGDCVAAPVGTSTATAPAEGVAHAPAGGLIDVSGLTFDELAATIGKDDLGRALDCILASGQNGSGYHGFSNHI